MEDSYQNSLSSEVIVPGEHEEDKERLHMLERLVIGGLDKDGKFQAGLLQHVDELRDQMKKANSILRIGVVALILNVLSNVEGFSKLIDLLVKFQEAL